jgi:hypothetical protein
MTRNTDPTVPEDWTPNLPTFVLSDEDISQRLSDVFVEARYVLGTDDATELVDTLHGALVAGWAEEAVPDRHPDASPVRAFTSEEIAARVGGVEGEIRGIAGEDTPLVVDIVYNHLTGDWSADV